MGDLGTSDESENPIQNVEGIGSLKRLTEEANFTQNHENLPSSSLMQNLVEDMFTQIENWRKLTNIVFKKKIYNLTLFLYISS